MDVRETVGHQPVVRDEAVAARLRCSDNSYRNTTRFKRDQQQRDTGVE